MNAVPVLKVPITSVDSRRNGLAAARAVSVLLTAVMAISALVGLTAGGVYRDADGLVALLRGYDLVALVVAAPLLGAALLARTARSVLVWSGLLVYAGYNYAYYLFGTQLNALFALHAAAVGLAVVGLILLMTNLDVGDIAARYRRRAPARSVAGVLLVLGISLAGLWLFTIARALLSGSALDEPSRLVVPEEFTHLGAALDLAFLVPAYVLAGVLLWRRVAWGYAIAAALLVAGVLHQVAYMVALVFQALRGVAGATAFDPAEPVIAGAFIVAAALMLAHCDRRPGSQTFARRNR